MTRAASIVAEQITSEIKKLTEQRRRQRWMEKTEQYGAVPIGQFRSLAGASVFVELSIAVDTGVRATAMATCSGFGCIESTHEVESGGDWVLSADHARLTEQERHEALAWAQSHAETCRAMPRPTA